MSGSLIPGNFTNISSTAEARTRVAKALGWPREAVQLVTMQGAAVVFDVDALPEEGLDEVMVVLDGEALKRRADAFAKELPLLDPPPLLVFASLNGNIGAVRAHLLLGQDPDEVDVQRGGRTALHVAAGRNEVEITELLLSAQADVGIVDDEGFSALHHAAKCQAADVAKALLNAGANRNRVAVPRYDRSRRGKTPTQLAVATGNFGIIEVFTDHVLRAQKVALILPGLAGSPKARPANSSTASTASN